MNKLQRRMQRLRTRDATATLKAEAMDRASGISDRSGFNRAGNSLSTPMTENCILPEIRVAGSLAPDQCNLDPAMNQRNCLTQYCSAVAVTELHTPTKHSCQHNITIPVNGQMDYLQEET